MEAERRGQLAWFQYGQQPRGTIDYIADKITANFRIGSWSSKEFELFVKHKQVIIFVIEQEEPCEARVSSTVPWECGGETPLHDSTIGY